MPYKVYQSESFRVRRDSFGLTITGRGKGTEFVQGDEADHLEREIDGLAHTARTGRIEELTDHLLSQYFGREG